MYDIIRGRVVVIIKCYPLTTECGNVSLHHIDTMTDWRENGQGSLFVLLVFEPVYPLLWWYHSCIYGGFKGRSLQIEKVFFGAFLYDMNHPLDGIYFLVREIFMTYDECVGL